MSSNKQLSDEAQHLALVPLFSQLDAHDLANLAEEVDQVFFKSGEAIFHEFDQGDALYLVESGAVRVWVHDDDVQQITLSELKPGDFFGELSVLDKGERSANASFAAEQDFKVNLKSELMLDDLTRNDRERSIQLKERAGVMKEIQGRKAIEDQGVATLVAN